MVDINEEPSDMTGGEKLLVHACPLKKSFSAIMSYSETKLQPIILSNKMSYLLVLWLKGIQVYGNTKHGGFQLP